MKTSELSDIDLDWAVAVSLGLGPVLRHDHLRATALANNYKGDLDWHLQGPNDPITVAASGASRLLRDYHRDWSLSGPIVEREVIATTYSELQKCWIANPVFAVLEQFKGPTLLIAAMRCFVSITLGDEVEIPEMPEDLYAPTHPRNAKKLAS